MSENTFDLMKIWTQGDPESERAMKGMLLHGLDSVVGAGGDVLSKIKVDRPAFNPLVRWMEEQGYPSRVTAQLSGNTLHFTGSLFGKAARPESLRKVVRPGTILEGSAGRQVKVTSIDGQSASVAAYGNTQLTDDPQPAQWDIIAEAGRIFAMRTGPDHSTGYSARSGPRYSPKPSRSPRQEKTPDTKSSGTRRSIRSSLCWAN
jgi:hypothetical protein